MSDMLTDDHHDWVLDALGVDPRTVPGGDGATPATKPAETRGATFTTEGPAFGTNDPDALESPGSCGPATVAMEGPGDPLAFPPGYKAATESNKPKSARGDPVVQEGIGDNGFSPFGPGDKAASEHGGYGAVATETGSGGNP